MKYFLVAVFGLFFYFELAFSSDATSIESEHFIFIGNSGVGKVR